MVGDVRREMRRLREKEASKSREEKEKKIKEEIIRKIKFYQREIKRLEKEVIKIYEKEKLLLSQGKNVRAKIIRWRRENKQRQLEELKEITPLAKSQ